MTNAANEAVLDPVELCAELMREIHRLKVELASSPSDHLKSIVLTAIPSIEICRLVDDEAFIDALISNTHAWRLLQKKLHSPLALPRWLVGHRYSELSGLSEKALKAKRATRWAEKEGIFWTLAGDGKMYYNWSAIDEWVISSTPQK